MELQRRHSEDVVQPWLMRSASRLLRAAFRRAATITLVIIRMKLLVATAKKSSKSDKKVTSPPTPPRLCGGYFCTYELLDGPLVVRDFLSYFPSCLSTNCICADIYVSML